MEIRPFLEKDQPPKLESLQQVLKKAYAYYLDICRLATAFSQEWSYSKGSGWMLKVYKRQKALFYLIPLAELLRISMAIREEEKIRMLEDPALESYWPMLRQAKSFSEGFQLQFFVSDNQSWENFRAFITQLLVMRG